MEEALLAILAVEVNVGIDIGAERRAEISVTLSQNMSAAELLEATELLKMDTTLGEKLRFKGTLIPADFREVLGDECHSKLYTYAEIIVLHDRYGGDITEHFAPFRVEGRDKPMWKRV